MKTATVTIGGKEYTACFSAYVIAKCEDRAGSVEKILEEVHSNKLSSALWLMAQMLKAGELYEKINGGAPNKAPTYDELLVNTGLEDLNDVVFNTINETIMAGTSREVEVEPKNAETTQEE